MVHAPLSTYFCQKTSLEPQQLAPTTDHHKAGIWVLFSVWFQQNIFQILKLVIVRLDVRLNNVNIAFKKLVLKEEEPKIVHEPSSAKSQLDVIRMTS